MPKADPQEYNPNPIAGFGGLSLMETEELSSADVLPDFSRVGYKYGDEPIPTLPVIRRITMESLSEALASGKAADTTSYIQGVIDDVIAKGEKGAILLGNGTYHVSYTIYLDSDGLVLRGESRDGTVIMGTSTMPRSAIFLGRSAKERGQVLSTLRAVGYDGVYGSYFIKHWDPSTVGVSYGAGSPIDEERVPVGRLKLRVKDPSMFVPGDYVAIYRPATPEWISAIYMDRIAANGREGLVNPDGTSQNAGTDQWNTKLNTYQRYFWRRITSVEGNVIGLDAPVVMEMDWKFGGGYVYKYTSNRVSGSGVENLTIDNYFDKSRVDNKGRYCDEDHYWTGICVKGAQHCWVKDVTAVHMCFSHTSVASNSICITVENCASKWPVSIVNGGRRYAFQVSGAQLVLIRNCTTDQDRHSFVSSGVSGPIVYVNGTASNSFSDLGPHQDWATGLLYDNVTTDQTLNVQDRGNYGKGHGWSGANLVFWNCRVAKGITCQSPWTSAKNYSIGCIGSRKKQRNFNNDYYGKWVYDYCQDVLGDRPQGEWYPDRPFDSVGSESDRIDFNNIPAGLAAKSWWPEFSLKVFSHPESLYECMLEDRHSRGIFLNYL